jgi:hypothetical protein
MLAVMPCSISMETQRRLGEEDKREHVSFSRQTIKLGGAVCTENLNTGVVVMKSAQDGA